MKVSEIMTPEARCVGPDASLAVAAGLMRDLNVGAIPVCDHDRLTGMITDRDLAVRAVAEARDPTATQVRAVMSPDVVYAFDDQDIEEIARLMEAKQVRRLPVLNRDQRLVGIVSLGDVATGAGTRLSGQALQEISAPSRPASRGRSRPRKAKPARVSPQGALVEFRPGKQVRGFSLRAKDGEIGEVKDLYFDNLRWQVRYFVVETGSWLKRRMVLLSPDSVQGADWQGRELNVALTRDEIRHSPDWDSDRPVSRQYEAALRRHYDWPIYWGIDGGAGLGMPLTGPTPSPTLPDPATELEGDPHLFSVNALVGHHVHATDGEVSHVDDLLIDDERWAIRYLVVDTRNWWPGKKVILSPWWTSEVNWPARLIAVDLTRDAIKASPPYDPAQPFTAKAAWALHEYYGRPRHPDDEVATRSGLWREL